MKEIKYVDLVRRGLIPAGVRKIVKMGSERYLVYLPIDQNYLWKELNEKDVKVRIYVEIPEEESHEKLEAKA